VTAHFLTIATKSSNARGQRRGYPKVLVEECVHGFEVSVEVLAMGGGRFHVFGVTDKTIGGHNHFVELGHLFPSQLDERIVARCEDVAVAALRAVGFDLGMAHVEVRYNLTSGPSLIEINPRPPGGKITDLIDHSLDVRCLELVVRQYLGEHIRDELPARASRGAAVRYLTADPGTVVSVSGIEAAAGIRGVTEAVVYSRVGEQVRSLRRNHDRIGHVLAVAGNAYLAGRLAEAGAHEIAVITR
jgi:biotin carboxylase